MYNLSGLQTLKDKGVLKKGYCGYDLTKHGRKLAKAAKIEIL
jgi:Mn-dependent DtxR family transcriptional regulator